MKKIFGCIMAIVMMLTFTSCVKIEWDDIINPEANFIYYYWKTCPHCIALHKTLVKKDIYSKNILEKKEVWKNPKNQEEFKELTDKLWLAPEDVWVPFLYIKSSKKHHIGEWNIVPILEAAIAEMWENK